MLRSISGYKDSDKLADQCLDTIYNKAVGLMNAAQTEQECQTAEEILRSISGHKDSDKLADQCAIYKLDIIYNKAIRLINAAQTEQDCQDAEKILRSISGYKDSDNLANQCCTLILQQLRKQAQQKAKEEEEEEERRLEALRQQSLYQAMESRRWNGLCQHCGGAFKKRVCRKCGRPKDY